MLSELGEDPIGLIIADIGDDRLVEPYIHDFIRSVYICTRTKNLTEEEYKVSRFVFLYPINSGSTQLILSHSLFC